MHACIYIIDKFSISIFAGLARMGFGTKFHRLSQKQMLPRIR